MHCHTQKDREERQRQYLREDRLGQTKALEESDGFGTTNSSIVVQIGSPEIHIEEIGTRRRVLRRRHGWIVMVQIRP